MIKRITLSILLVTIFIYNPLLIKAEESISSITYGEMENGLFIRTLEEEIASIPDGIKNPSFWDEYTRIVEARKLDELTPQMKEAGYILNENGMAYLPDYTGEISESEYKKQQTENNKNEKFGFVTFMGTVNDDIHQECYIAVEGVDNNNYYEFSLNEINGYTSLVQLPIGTYKVSEGGIASDYTSEFVISTKLKEFEVIENSSIIVYYEIKKSAEDNSVSGIIDEISQDGIEQNQFEVEEKSQSHSHGQKISIFWGIGFGMLLIAISGGIGYWLFRKRNRLD